MFFIIEEGKETKLDFFRWNHESIVSLFYFNIILIQNDRILHFKCKIVWFATQLIKIRNTGSWISVTSVIPGIPVNTGTEVTLNISSNSDSNGETNFPYRLVLTYTRVSRIRKTFANNSSANINLSKTHLHKMGQSGEFLGRFQRPLLVSVFPLMKNVLETLAKSVLISLGLKAAALAIDAAIQKKLFG